MRSVFLLSGKHLVGNFVIRRGLRNQLVDNTIDSFRKGFEACGNAEQIQKRKALAERLQRDFKAWLREQRRK